MERIGNEPLPLEEVDDMCPMVAAAVLNKKGYEIPIPKANCMMGVFNTIVNSALRRRGLYTAIYEGPRLAAGKMKLVKKLNDGILLLRSRSNPKVFHFISFIVDGPQLRFYDPDAGQLDVYRLKNGAIATDFDEDFVELFPDYVIVQIQMIEPVQGGMRPGSIKKAALQNLKDRGITGVMLDAAFHQLKVRTGEKVVSKMFGFKSWGYLRSDHVLEIKNKEGIMFRYKIARGKKHPVVLAKIPGSPYEEIMTIHVPDYGADDYDAWPIAVHQARHVTRKLKLKPRYRKTRKN